jgi:hypothetical protein
MVYAQFRVLYREFLFRIFDLELLSADAMGDANRLLGRFAALLVCIGLFLGVTAWEFLGHGAPSPARQLNLWKYEHFLVSTTMLVVGLFGVLSWDSIFPDRRDVLVLLPLPIPLPVLFSAKVAATGTALVMAVGLLHAAAGLIWPFALAAQTGLAAVLRSVLAYWLTLLSAGAFTFCCVLDLQGIAAQILPRRLFLRMGSWLQLAAFSTIVSVYMLQPITPERSHLDAAIRGSLLSWSPSYWFLALFQQLNGSAALAPLARRAWTGLAVALTAAALAYALCYLRTLRKVVEEPDIFQVSGRGGPLPEIGGAVQSAFLHFSIRTLLRSRVHRLVLAFYYGMGFAFLVILLKRSGQPAGATTSIWAQTSAVLPVASAVIMVFAAAGIRVVFSLPVDLRGNWIFRVTPLGSVSDCVVANRRSLLLLATAPVWVVSTALCFAAFPWPAAVRHAALLAATAFVLGEVCLLGLQKIPFTCSYLPGKSQVHIAVLGTAYMSWVIGPNLRSARGLVENPAAFAAAMLGMALLWGGARWANASAAKSEQAQIRFEEEGQPALQGLGLTFDGSLTMRPPSGM